ncbi:hypothetical protein GCM10010412_066600 [Nonomuraea recticatena]|uniref:Uncharacterized protein n=1 Tax=Nonomuraea recticatena TaxID=46178 RepID=A0ABN3SNC7_9ACTN
MRRGGGDGGGVHSPIVPKRIPKPKKRRGNFGTTFGTVVPGKTRFPIVHVGTSRKRRAQVLRWLVDALGEEGSRYLAQDAGDRALDVRQRAEALDANCGDPWPAPPTTTPRSL